MVIELPPELESALKMRANAEGLTVASYVRVVMERALSSELAPSSPKPLRTGRGSCAQFGPAPSAEEIDANRAEMFRSFGEGL